MNSTYFNYQKCVNDLTLVLSVGNFYKFSPKVVEKRIVNSKYFSLFNSELLNAQGYISSSTLIKNIFPEINVSDFKNTYIEFEWIAMMYLFLIDKTNFNFETLFLYINIETALQMFKVYHEMDFTASYTRFMELYNAKSVIKSKMNLLLLTNEEVSKQTSISLSMIDALKNRRRNIKKLELEKAYKLSKLLDIQIETLLNN